LFAKTELDRKILAAVILVSCAAFARGRISEEQLSELLGQLEVPDIELWFDLLPEEYGDHVRLIEWPRSW